MLLPAFWPDVGGPRRRTPGKPWESCLHPQRPMRRSSPILSAGDLCVPPAFKVSRLPRQGEKKNETHILLEEEDPLRAGGNRGRIPSI